MLFVIDFDGTIAPHDTVDALLEQFALPPWREVEEQWVRGEINSRECMAAQIGLIRNEPGPIRDFLQRVTIDPDFEEFVRYVRPFADLAIVSDGVDYTIRHAVRGIVPPLPIYANSLAFTEGGLALGFPYSDEGCKVKSGVCKCAVARALEGGRGLSTILIGDGQSDRCIATSADVVFAKASLRRFCEAENIDHIPFETFADVLAVVRTWTPAMQQVVPGRVNVY